MILSALCYLALFPVQQPGIAAAEGLTDPRFEVIALANTVAAEVSPVLESVLDLGEKVMADPRSNSLLVMADEAKLAKLRRVIAEIDMPVPPSSAADDLFPVPTGDLMIAADASSSTSLMSVVHEYARLTDQHFVIAADTSTYLEQARTGLSRSVVVPKDQVQSFFEQLMICNDFVLMVLRKESPRLLSLESLQTGSRNTVRADAIFVSPEELSGYYDHPALLITTVVNLPNTDVRQLSNSMRTMITDANTQQMLPAGNTNSMVLTGFASNVAPLARMLKIVDEASAVETIEPMYRRFQLKFAKAVEIAGSVEDLVISSNRRSSGVQAQGSPVANARRGHADARVMVDARTNALVVMAMPDDMKSIEELVRLFDVQQ